MDPALLKPEVEPHRSGEKRDNAIAAIHHVIYSTPR